MTSRALSLAPGPRLLPDFVFESIPQAVTCQSLALSWTYRGPATTFTFITTNAGVPQDAPAPPLTSSSPSTSRGPFTGTDDKQRRAIPTGAANPLSNVTVSVAFNIDPLASQTYTWEAVDVPQAWYQIVAYSSSQGYTSAASQFFVHTGDDTSCLVALPSSTTSNPSTSPTPSTSALPSASSSSLAVVLPVGGASRVSSGAIAGATIGGILLLVAVVAAWLCLQRKGKGTGVLASKSLRKWNGLSSVDSRALTSGNQKNFPSYRHQSRSESLGTIAVGASEEAVGMEKSSIYGKYSENGGSGVALAAMPVLHHHQGQQQQPGQPPRSKTNSRAYSISSSNEYLPHEVAVGVTPGRRPSVPDSIIGRQSIDSSNTYPPTSPVLPQGGQRNGASNQFTAANMVRSHSSNPSITQPSSPSSPTQSTSSHAFTSHQTNQFQRPAPSPSPQSPTNPTIDAATKKANRNSLGGKKRKPVPAYDPGREDITSLPVPRVAATPSPAPSFSSPTTANSGGGGHYATRSQVGKDSSQHDLVHKSSFGPGGVEGKPLHYLIPDMPMQPKE